MIIFNKILSLFSITLLPSVIFLFSPLRVISAHFSSRFCAGPSGSDCHRIRNPDDKSSFLLEDVEGGEEGDDCGDQGCLALDSVVKLQHPFHPTAAHKVWQFQSVPLLPLLQKSIYSYSKIDIYSPFNDDNLSNINCTCPSHPGGGWAGPGGGRQRADRCPPAQGPRSRTRPWSLKKFNIMYEILPAFPR